MGIVSSDGKIIANEKSVYTPELGKGIIPLNAAEHHKKFAEEIFGRALEKSKLSIEDVDIISYSAGPGLSPCLIVGADFAINLSKKYKKPLTPVPHTVAHLEIGKLTTNTKDPIFVYLSGGSTQIIAFTGGKYRIFGETLDVTIGNTLDVLARELNLPMPGGSEIEKLAKCGKYLELPIVIKGMDLSFSGIQTAAIKKLKDGARPEDVAYSMQETCFSMLTEVTERALAHTGKKEVLLVGGVAANKRLQEMMEIMCEERGAKFFVVPHEYATDNGAMIAWLGLLAHKSGWKLKTKDKILPKWRIDDVEITWIK